MTDELGLTAYTDLTYAEVQAIQANAWREGFWAAWYGAVRAGHDINFGYDARVAMNPYEDEK